MKKDSPLYNKSINFAERIMDMSDYLFSVAYEQAKKESNYPRISYSLENCLKQITRSGTSIGANIAEGNEGQSSADMIAKFTIALRELRETEYWLTLLNRKNVINQEMHKSLHDDLSEIARILNASLKTLKSQKKVTSKKSASPTPSPNLSTPPTSQP